MNSHPTQPNGKQHSQMASNTAGWQAIQGRGAGRRFNSCVFTVPIHDITEQIAVDGYRKNSIELGTIYHQAEKSKHGAPILVINRL